MVLKGAYLYRDDAGEKRVAAGEFIRIPGKHKHWSGGDSTEGALFYQESSGKVRPLACKVTAQKRSTKRRAPRGILFFEQTLSFQPITLDEAKAAFPAARERPLSNKIADEICSI